MGKEELESLGNIKLVRRWKRRLNALKVKKKGKG
jgi:hypothetical protein